MDCLRNRSSLDRAAGTEVSLFAIANPLNQITKCRRKPDSAKPGLREDGD